MQSSAHDNLARRWRGRALPGVELFKARFTTYAFDRHFHEDWAVGVIEAGAQAFRHGGAEHVAPVGAMITVNPGEVHDGRSAGPGGYRYRMAYLDAEELARVLGRRPGHFAAPVTVDAAVAPLLDRALTLADAGDDPLAAQSLFTRAVAALFERHAAPGAPGPEPRPDLSGVLELMAERAAEPLTLEDLAAHAGLSRAYFLRAFKRRTGLTPHAWLMARRLEIARRALARGRGIAQAAADCGFTDQAHLTRRFKAAYGLTPGRYRSEVC